MLASLVASCLTTLNVEIESASVGPAFGGGHDQRILEVCCAQYSAPLSDVVTSFDGLYIWVRRRGKIEGDQDAFEGRATTAGLFCRAVITGEVNQFDPVRRSICQPAFSGFVSGQNSLIFYSSFYPHWTP